MSAAIRPLREDLILQPHAEDAEQAVLSAMMMDAWAIEQAISRLDSSAFYSERHRRIFLAIAAISERKSVVDPLILSEELSRRGQLEAVGGKDYIGYLVDAAPTAANVEYHAGIVVDAYHRRLLGERLKDDLHSTRTGDRNAIEIVQELQSALDRLAASPREGGMALLSDIAILDLPPIEFLIDAILPAGGTGTLFGAPGLGKSFVALDLALCVASGKPFFGHIVKRCPVVFVAAEGAAGLPNRVNAWRQHHGYEDTGELGVYFATEPVQLLEGRSVSVFLSAIRKLGEPRPGLIIMDTLARCMAGGDENSTRDMGMTIAAVDRIRRDTGAAVLLIHHTRKDGDLERGSSALRGAMDAMLWLKGDDDELTIVSEKEKDAAKFTPIQVRLEPVANSCVVTPGSEMSRSGKQKLTPRHRQALLSLSRSFLSVGATLSEWMTASGITKAEERTFYRTRTDLVREGYVAAPPDKSKARGWRYTLTDSGRMAVSDNCQSSDTDCQSVRAALVDRASQ